MKVFLVFLLIVFEQHLLYELAIKLLISQGKSKNKMHVK